jgi:hypothetical protein
LDTSDADTVLPSKLFENKDISGVDKPDKNINTKSFSRALSYRSYFWISFEEY